MTHHTSKIETAQHTTPHAGGFLPVWLESLSGTIATLEDKLAAIVANRPIDIEAAESVLYDIETLYKVRKDAQARTVSKEQTEEQTEETTEPETIQMFDAEPPAILFAGSEETSEETNEEPAEEPKEETKPETSEQKAAAKIRWFYNGVKVGDDKKLHKCYYSFVNDFTRHDGEVIPAHFTIYGKNYCSLPAELHAVGEIQNNTETMTDYFENDRIYVEQDNPYFAQVAEAYLKGEAHKTKTTARFHAKRGQHAAAEKCLKIEKEQADEFRARFSL